jgi:sphingolipid delta-4 desaturase
MTDTSATLPEELKSQADDSFVIRTHEFMEVDYAEPHLARGRRLLKKHPEITKLFGRNPWTLPLAIAVSGTQIATAVALAHFGAPWWLMLIVAFAFGAFLCNTNSSIIHDASHDRVTHARIGNELTGWIANLPNIIPVASSFRIYHMKHHRFQGDPEFDADMASKAEADLFGGSFIGKLAWEILFPVIQTLRTRRFLANGRIPFITPWVIANFIIQFSFDALIVYLAGPWAMFYLAASFIFSLGPHPLGARYVQEHFIFHKNQETYSYYGPLNVLGLNVYHHNEHHDFPAVPWNRLPKVRAAIPEVYNQLYYHNSLTGLWLKFLFDPTVSLHRRIVRHYNVDGSDPVKAPAAAAHAAE